MFANRLTDDDKYSRRYIQTFWQQVQRLYLKKQKVFLDF